MADRDRDYAYVTLVDARSVAIPTEAELVRLLRSEREGRAWIALRGEIVHLSAITVVRFASPEILERFREAHPDLV